MASLQLIPRLDPSNPIFIPLSTDFEGTVAQQLGDLGSGSDGWDALFAIPAGAIDLDAAGLTDFDVLLAAFDFNPGDVASALFTPVDGAMIGFLQNGDALNAAVQTPGSGTGTVTITPAPAPPGSGYGGEPGTGGSGAGGGPFVGPPQQEPPPGE